MAATETAIMLRIVVIVVPPSRFFLRAPQSAHGACTLFRPAVRQVVTAAGGILRAPVRESIKIDIFENVLRK
jgi:hypothetical protein